MISPAPTSRSPNGGSPADGAPPRNAFKGRNAPDGGSTSGGRASTRRTFIDRWSDATPPSSDALTGNLSTMMRLSTQRAKPLDLAILLCLLGLAITLGMEMRHLLGPIAAPGAATIHLSPLYLPGYALRTVMRMIAALLASVCFTFTYAVLAAKSRRAGRFMIPALDVLQSVPILGFLSFTVTFFLGLFPGSMLGVECAAIFTLFTSQAWNMAFAMVQGLHSVPEDLSEAMRGFGLTAWQRFWRLEVPCAIPALVWNAMMSMSGGWFMLVYSETITVGNTNIVLPGVGSYLATAILQRNGLAVLWAILAMMVVILAYDQLVFRPLGAWAARFRLGEIDAARVPEPWAMRLFRRAPILRQFRALTGGFLHRLALLPLGRRWEPLKPAGRDAPGVSLLAGFVLVVATGAALLAMTHAWSMLSAREMLHVVELGVITLLRVVSMVALATLIWVPVGVWIGLRPVWARRAQLLAQYMAAFPANLFFPVFVVGILTLHLSPDLWLTPLIILGAQWYILFNVIGGVMNFPRDLLQVSRNFNVRGLLWWRRIMLPGIAPSVMTGALTASGGAWNAAIVAEMARWGDQSVTAHGLGAYIAQATIAGDMPRVALGVTVMACFVVLLNRLFWRPLADHAYRRLAFQSDT